MESIGRLAGGLAHDFNNLLTVINGYANVALKELGPQHALAEPIDEIRKAGEAAAELIRQLLAFSRKQMLRQEAVDVNAMLREMAPSLSALAGAPIEIRTALAPSVNAVSADRGQIEQVIRNLTVHARDAMPHGGVLTIETKDVTRGPVGSHCLAELRPGAYVCISLRDTGAGMDEATRQHLFEPFFGRESARPGSGLSLATVHGIVLQSGGHIDVESRPGAGTLFAIYLPAVEEIANAPEVAAAHRDESVPPGNATILLVEDQPEVRRFTAGLLQQSGYEVLEAASAEEALSRGPGQPIDLLLTDVRLPGMNGCDLAAALRSWHPGARVLFMSGYAEEMLTGHAAALRGAAVIQKPFRPGALADKVRDVLSAAPGEF
jgi:CheY-like chemotaxis protein